VVDCGEEENIGIHIVHPLPPNGGKTTSFARLVVSLQV
jgi:hypothetical protein